MHTVAQDELALLHHQMRKKTQNIILWLDPTGILQQGLTSTTFILHRPSDTCCPLPGKSHIWRNTRQRNLSRKIPLLIIQMEVLSQERSTVANAAHYTIAGDHFPICTVTKRKSRRPHPGQRVQAGSAEPKQSR